MKNLFITNIINTACPIKSTIKRLAPTFYFDLRNYKPILCLSAYYSDIQDYVLICKIYECKMEC